MEAVAETLKMLVTTFIALPVLTPVVLPVLGVWLYVARYAAGATAQLRRLTSNAKSLICSDVSDAYGGAASIRVYKSIERFRAQFNRHLDRTLEVEIAEIVADSWVQVRSTSCLVDPNKQKQKNY